MTSTKAVQKIKVVKTDAEFLVEREREIRKSHKRVNEGTIRREESGSHAGKLTVEMRCLHKGCEKTRRVATSDLFQVKFCEDCTVEKRNKKRRLKAVATRKAKAEAKAASNPATEKKARKRKAKPVVNQDAAVLPVPVESEGSLPATPVDNSPSETPPAYEDAVTSGEPALVN